MSRTDSRSKALRRRPSRTVPAVIMALILLALAVAMVWLSVLKLLSGVWPDVVVSAANWAQDVSWGSTTAITAAAGVAVVGVILLLWAIIPGQFNAMRVQNDDLDSVGTTTEVVMTRRSVARLATARAVEVDGVEAASASAGGQSVTLSVTTESSDRNAVETTVKQRVHQALISAGVNPLPRIAVNVRTR